MEKNSEKNSLCKQDEVIKYNSNFCRNSCKHSKCKFVLIFFFNFNFNYILQIKLYEIMKFNKKMIISRVFECSLFLVKSSKLRFKGNL